MNVSNASALQMPNGINGDNATAVAMPIGHPDGSSGRGGNRKRLFEAIVLPDVQIMVRHTRFSYEQHDEQARMKNVFILGEFFHVTTDR